MWWLIAVFILRIPFFIFFLNEQLFQCIQKFIFHQQMYIFEVGVEGGVVIIYTVFSPEHIFPPAMERLSGWEKKNKFSFCLFVVYVVAMYE